MKKIFMLLATCVAMVFVSCSKDDDNGGTTNKDGQRLVSKIIYNEVSGNDTDVSECNFTYDSEGNVSEVTESYTRHNETSRYITTIKRDGNKVTMTELDLEDQSKYYTWCTLDDDGRVIKEEDNDNSVTTFAYDNSGQLIKITTPDEDNCNREYTWKQGNMTNSKHWHINSSGDKYDNTETSYEYTLHSNNINIDFTWVSWGSFYMDTYFGKTNKNLLKSYSESDGNKDEYEYEFDGDYVSTVKEYNTYKGGERKLTGTYHIYYK